MSKRPLLQILGPQAERLEPGAGEESRPATWDSSLGNFKSGEATPGRSSQRDDRTEGSGGGEGHREGPAQPGKDQRGSHEGEGAGAQPARAAAPQARQSRLCPPWSSQVRGSTSWGEFLSKSPDGPPSPSPVRHQLPAVPTTRRPSSAVGK